MTELIATVTGYLMIIALCVFVITMGVYWTVHRIIDVLGVRDKFLSMKREYDAAQHALSLVEAADCHKNAGLHKDNSPGLHKSSGL